MPFAGSASPHDCCTALMYGTPIWLIHAVAATLSDRQPVSHKRSENVKALHFPHDRCRVGSLAMIAFCTARSVWLPGSGCGVMKSTGCFAKSKISEISGALAALAICCISVCGGFAFFHSS